MPMATIKTKSKVGVSCEVSVCRLHHHRTGQARSVRRTIYSLLFRSIRTSIFDPFRQRYVRISQPPDCSFKIAWTASLYHELFLFVGISVGLSLGSIVPICKTTGSQPTAGRLFGDSRLACRTTLRSSSAESDMNPGLAPTLPFEYTKMLTECFTLVRHDIIQIEFQRWNRLPSCSTPVYRDKSLRNSTASFYFFRREIRQHL